MQSITLHQLKVFEAAARNCSFTRAAEELFLTQPTISMQMKQLSKAIGLPLFEQIGKRLYLTEAGEELLATSKEIFEKFDQLDMKIADLKGLKQGQLRLAVITTAKYVIPRLLGPFCQQHPNIDISLKVTNHTGVLERIAENEDDLYIVSQPPEHLKVNLYSFVENPLVVLAPRNHPLAQEKHIPLQRLAEEPFIMREEGSATRRAVQTLFDQHQVPIKVKLELGSNEAIKQAIASGLGVSVLSLHTLILEGTDGPLKILPVEHFPIPRNWYVVYPEGKQLSIVANTFFEFLKKEGKQIADLSNLLKTEA